MSQQTLLAADTPLQSADIPKILGGAAEANARVSQVFGHPFLAPKPAACLP